MLLLLLLLLLSVRLHGYVYIVDVDIADIVKRCIHGGLRILLLLLLLLLLDGVGVYQANSLHARCGVRGRASRARSALVHGYLLKLAVYVGVRVEITVICVDFVQLLLLVDGLGLVVVVGVDDRARPIRTIG